MPPAQIIRRTLLYVPAFAPKFLEKFKGLSVDTVIYDLEDSVAPNKNEEARKGLCEFLKGQRPENIKELAVRINSVDGGYALDDLTAIIQTPNLDAVVIPKVQTPADMHFITDVLHHLKPDRNPMPKTQSAAPYTSASSPSSEDKPPIHLIPLIESALGLHN